MAAPDYVSYRIVGVALSAAMPHVATSTRANLPDLQRNVPRDTLSHSDPLHYMYLSHSTIEYYCSIGISKIWSRLACYNIFVL